MLEHRLGPLKHKFQKDAIPMLRVTFNLGKNVPVPQADVPLVHEDMSTRDVRKSVIDNLSHHKVLGIFLVLQILEYLNAEHRLNVFQTGEILQLQLGQIDQERLRLPNCVLSLEEKIIPLGLQHAILTKSKFIVYRPIQTLVMEKYGMSSLSDRGIRGFLPKENYHFQTVGSSFIV